MRISRPAGQSVPSVAGCKLSIGGLEDIKMVGTRNSNLLKRFTNPLFICCLVTVGLCLNTASALPGSGIQEDPWRIESLADFDEFAADPNYWAGFTRLETDVNLAGRTYTTAVIASLTGVFDGNDHKIIGMTIDDAGTGNDYLGLFGYNYGQVMNLGLEGGSISGDYRVGGLVGVNYGSISNCYSTGDINGRGSVGGLVGANGDEGNVSNCYSTSDVNGIYYVGGLVGENGQVLAAPHVPGHIINSYYTGDVNGVSCVGGLVGINVGTVSNCYSNGHLSGEYSVGGLVGNNGYASIRGGAKGFIFNSYSTSSVNGTGGPVGGLVGSSFGSIGNCYSTGDINGRDSVGGLVGHNGFPESMGCPFPGIVCNSYSISNVQGEFNVGALIGYNESGGIGGAFWDVETSGEPNMCGGQNEEYATGCNPNCGKTTAEMQTRSTFTDAGWDFVEIWGIGENQTYPYLSFAPAGDFNYDKKVDLFDLAIMADHWLEGR